MELQENYKVNLPAFEGPLDLLLFLIRKSDLNIYDIPIAFITEEYLKYLEAMRELDIDLAGEFLAMAAELMLIKSRMLLPQESAGEEEEGEDPRAELARRLLEYQRFKTAASQLFKRPMLGREIFAHPFLKVVASAEEEIPLKGEVFQLMQAFSEVLKRVPKDLYHEVTADRIGITDRIYQIVDILNEKETALLDEILPDPLTRYDVVITFMALLEMARLKMIHVYQDGRFAQIAIRRAMTIGSAGSELPALEGEI